MLGSVPTNRNVITYSPGTRLRVVAQTVPQAGTGVKGTSPAGHCQARSRREAIEPAPGDVAGAGSPLDVGSPAEEASAPALPAPS